MVMNIKLFADGADIDGMLRLYANPMIQGFTTNPTLMRKAGVTDYQTFAQEVLAKIPDRPISFEVFADDPEGMLRQARVIAGWGPNVNVKVPVTNSRGEFTGSVIRELSQEGIVLNVTAVMTPGQVRDIAACLDIGVPAIVSVFAGRIADTGRDPIPYMTSALHFLRDRPKAELLWASPREVLNISQADSIGCHIITATSDILAKLALAGKDLAEYSLDTVKMFYNDAQAAGFSV